LLVGSLRSLGCLLVVRLGRLGRVRNGVWVVHEIARRCKACRVWLLLLNSLGMWLLSSLTLRWEDWVGEGRGSGGIISRILGKLFIGTQVKVETIVVVVVVVVVLHLVSTLVLSSAFKSEMLFRSK
jgi:hypothetical protein